MAKFAIEFSRDGKTWSAEAPYTLEHRWDDREGAGAVHARLILTNTKGRQPLKPIKISLP